MKNQIASETLNQLGGSRFIAMTGASCYSDNNTLVVKFKGSRSANIAWITLNDLDLYNIRFAKYTGMKIKEVKQVENAYSDMLRPIFEQVTGLRTSL